MNTYSSVLVLIAISLVLIIDKSQFVVGMSKVRIKK